MVKLSEFVGEVVSELAHARQMADMSSVRLSQMYHADSFLKEMPVPHYTIDEAEISFPLSIVSVLGGADDHFEDRILDAVRLKLPTLLYQAMKESYKEKKKDELIRQQEEKQAKQNTVVEGAETTPADDVIVEMGKGMEKSYGQIANRISGHMEVRMKNYFSSVNMEVVKPLDVKDVFMDALQKEYVTEFSSVEQEKQPVADSEALADMIKSVGTNIFFEFMYEGEGEGILVDSCTGRLGEYASKDHMMQLKLKVKEQDLNVVVTDENGDKSAKRFLSLN